MSRHGHANDGISFAGIEGSLQAKQEVLRVIKARPEVLGGIGAPKDATDRELLQALARADSPRAVLREAGHDPASASKAAQLLPEALEALNAGSGGRKWRRNWWKYALCTGALCLITLGLFCSFFYLAVIEKAGWTSGKCNIIGFFNRTCATQCLFDVKILQAGRGKVLNMRGWQPPFKQDFRTEQTSFVGEAFRCCDVKQKLNCCEFVDPETMYFCDAWPFRVGPDGKSCPAGDWECRFKFQEGSEHEITKLEAIMSSAIQNQLLALSLVFGLFCACSATSSYWEPLVCSYAKSKNPKEAGNSPEARAMKSRSLTSFKLHKPSDKTSEKREPMNKIESDATSRSSRSREDADSTESHRYPSLHSSEGSAKSPLNLEISVQDPAGFQKTPSDPRSPASAATVSPTASSTASPTASPKASLSAAPLSPTTLATSADLSVVLDPLSEGRNPAFEGDSLKRLAAEHNKHAAELMRPIIAPLGGLHSPMARPAVRGGARSKSSQARRLRVTGAHSPHLGNFDAPELWAWGEESKAFGRHQAGSHADPPSTWAWAGQAQFVDGHHVVDVGPLAHNSPLRVTASSPSGSTRSVQGTPLSGESAKRMLAEFGEAAELSPAQLQALGNRPRASHKRRRDPLSDRHAAFAAAAVRETVSRGSNRF